MISRHGNVFHITGGRFNKKMSSYQYRKSHCGDKTILRPSYLHNGISYTDKMTFLYWIRALALCGGEGGWGVHWSSLIESLIFDNFFMLVWTAFQTIKFLLISEASTPMQHHRYEYSVIQTPGIKNDSKCHHQIYCIAWKNKPKKENLLTYDRFHSFSISFPRFRYFPPPPPFKHLQKLLFLCSFSMRKTGLEKKCSQQIHVWSCQYSTQWGWPKFQ